MEESAISKQLRTRARTHRWEIFGMRIGRVSRWLVCSVILAAAPILLSFIFLPRDTSVTTFLAQVTLPS